MDYNTLFSEIESAATKRELLEVEHKVVDEIIKRELSPVHESLLLDRITERRKELTR